VGLGNFAADLSNIFGASWATNSPTQGNNLQWGVVGGTPAFSSLFGLSQDTIFLTSAEQTPGDGSTVRSPASQTIQNGWYNDIYNATNAGEGWNTFTTSTNSDYGAPQAVSNGDSWSNEIANHDFGTSQDIEQPLNGGFFGPTNSELDLYELAPGTSSGTELGSFTLSNAGALTYTAAVPEPSTYATVALGAAFLFLFRRRFARRVLS